MTTPEFFDTDPRTVTLEVDLDGPVVLGASGPPGPPGADGEDGADGAPGAPGVGVPTGGTAGQALTKNTATNYDTGWSTIAGGGGAPTGAAGGSLSGTYPNPTLASSVVAPANLTFDPATQTELDAEVTARTNADALLIPLTQKAAASGVATLDGTTYVPTAQLGTGSASSTTYLRGDRTWSTPAGGGGAAGSTTGPLGVKGYNPGTRVDASTTSATYADIDATNLIVTFVAPPSGAVVLSLSAIGVMGPSSQLSWCVRSGGSNVTASITPLGYDSDATAAVEQRMTARVYVPGLTPSASYTWTWAHARVSGPSIASTSYGGNQGPALMEVWDAVPGTSSGSGSAGILGMTRYSPNPGVNTTTTSSTFTDVDATNLAVTFTVPASGKVLVELSAAYYSGAATPAAAVAWNLREGTTNLTGTGVTLINLEGLNNGAVRQATTKHYVSGLTPGTSKTYKWGHARASGTVPAGTVYGQATDTDNGAAFMVVFDAAPTSGGGTASPTYTEKYAGMYVPKRALDRWQQAAKPWTTTLASSMTNVATSLTVTGLEGIPPFTRFRAFIENEQVLVTAGAGTTTWTVIRAVNGTSGVAHSAGIPVTGEGVLRVVTIGDSTSESAIGGGGGTAGGGSGGDGWVTRMSRVLSRISGLPLLSPPLGTGGFFGVWRNSDTNIGGGAGNSAVDWTCPSGAWTLITPGVGNDRAPWGWIAVANGATNVLKLTVPAYMGSILGVDVYFEEGNVGTAGFSYDINNSGTWVNGGGGTGVLNNTLHRSRLTSGVPITDFRIRAANAGGTAITSCRILGVDLWPTAPTTSTYGIKVTNLGKDADFLSQLNRTNASGDNYALFDGDAGSLYPDLCLLGPFTNDVLTGSGAYANYGTNLNALVSRIKPYSDVILVAYSEQGGARAPADQATLRNWVHTVAQNQGVAYLDMYDALVAQGITGWAAADTEGLHGTIHDVNHYGPLGHQEMASRFDRMLTSF